ncbi:TsaA-like domain-containing protein [Tribonema minus]|uniref:TsaA-like domain-containing protein n=1 Tax=Tribonema minus TaxID=303371 RepID=A0A835YKX6_9STRA|nr:TsaA-like domain-containing protein [Tribonema minus]
MSSGASAGHVAAPTGSSSGGEVAANDAPQSIFNFVSVATVQTPFRDRRGTPRQGSVAPLSRGTVVFHPHIVSPAALDNLQQFSHAWVLFVFHENTNARGLEGKKGAGRPTTFRAKISPPRLGGPKVGVFSTRSPHRPNPIGLTMVRILGVQGHHLHVSGLDLVDGTPVLDVKPVVPYDVPDGLAVPEWVLEGDKERRRVTWSRAAQLALHALFERRGARASRFYDNPQALSEAAAQVLAQDIRGVHQGRGSASDGGGCGGAAYECVFDGLRLLFVHADGAVIVQDVVVA